MSFAEEFEKLRLEFEHHSADRIAAMQELADALGREPDDPTLIDRLRVHFHAFAGLGTTYGRPQATALGERGEERTADLVKRGTGASAADVLAMRELIEGLRAEFHQRRS